MKDCVRSESINAPRKDKEDIATVSHSLHSRCVACQSYTENTTFAQQSPRPRQFHSFNTSHGGNNVPEFITQKADRCTKREVKLPQNHQKGKDLKNSGGLIWLDDDVFAMATGAWYVNRFPIFYAASPWRCGSSHHYGHNHGKVCLLPQSTAEWELKLFWGSIHVSLGSATKQTKMAAKKWIWLPSHQDNNSFFFFPRQVT